MANKKNHFLAYLRQGITASVKTPSAELQQRMSIEAKLKVGLKSKKGTKQKDILEDIILLGPGDVLGFNPRMVNKVMPIRKVINFEPSLTPFIEFKEADFLWRFSTSKNNNNWIPWLSLIILKAGISDDDSEFEIIESSNRDLPSQIQLKANAILPDLKESWRWAHVHLLDLDGDLNAIKKSIKSNPSKSVCRLLSPRRLKPQTKYHAFVVPTYLIGQQAAFGFSTLTNDRTQLAWETPENTTGKILPYYYDWSFRTDIQGDFEYLIRKLKPVELKDLGTQTIDCSQPGYGMQADGFTMEMEAPLKAINTDLQKWGMDASPPEAQQTKLANLLNQREVGTGKNKKLRVTPPVYGEWYTRKNNTPTDLNEGNKRQWLGELNLDFRHRAAAGLGVQFVKDNQEQLMQAAWTQLSKVKEANRALNLGRFGRSISRRMYKRINQMKPEAIAKLAMPLKTKITYNASTKKSVRTPNAPKKTLFSFLKNATIPNSLVNIKAKKYLPKYKITRASNRAGGGGKITNPFASIRLDQLVLFNFQMGPVTSIQNILPPSDEELKNDPYFHPIGIQLKNVLDPKLTIGNKIAKRFEKLRTWEKRSTPTRNSGLRNARNTRNEQPDSLRPVMWHPEFHRPMYRFLREMSQEYILPGLENIPPNSIGTLMTNRRFIEAFMIGLNHEMAAELRWREFPADMRGSYFRSFWDTTIYSMDNNEKALFKKSINGQRMVVNIKRTYGNSFSSFEKIEATYIKGDANKIEKSVAKAYEDAVEKWLLTRDEDKDIDHPVKWRANSRLGNHSQRKEKKNKGKDEIVILIRGELLQKFPNTIIYLAKKTAANKLDLDNTTRTFPIFEGALPPDIVFLGFPITENDASKYYLIFEERASALRFGLDVNDEADNNTLSNMKESNLSWEHFSTMPAEGYLDGHQPLIVSNNWNSAAYVGKVMLQKQVRVAVALNEMLPGK